MKNSELNDAYQSYLQTHDLDALLRTVIRFGRIITGSDDGAQNVAIRVWRYLPPDDPSKGSFSAWLHKVARNERIEMHRRAVKNEYECLDELLREPVVENDTRSWEIQEANARLAGKIEQLHHPLDRKLLRAIVKTGTGPCVAGRTLGWDNGKSSFRLTHIKKEVAASGLR